MLTVFLLIKSIIAGFIVAVPIGAIGAMCLRRALQGRWGVSLVTGGGAAFADSILAAAAMFGLTLLTRYIFDHQAPLLLVGGIFLIAVGIRMIHKRHPKIDAMDSESTPQSRSLRDWLSAFSTGFVLTIINPATFLAFVGVFAGMGFFKDRPDELLQNWIIIVGIFAGSMLWWTTLTTTAFAVRRHLSLEFIVIINVVLGLVVAAIGVGSLLSLVGVIPRL
ncbi:MAG: LysE family transporter [Rhodospirillales bacterium]|nr:LysE family transporter [Rhodospirillales bacterium]